MATPHASYLRHADYRYLKLALLLCLASIAVYWWHEPLDGPNGGSWLGYTLGTIGALLIVWLTALGFRKRHYRSQFGTVKGWTSAHVYLGLSLILIATLHTGFQFGWNIHTLAYALMLLVIASGVYGIFAYARYPTAITENLGVSERDTMIDEVLDINQQSLKLADQLDPAVHRIIVRSCEHMKIGGGLRDQLFGPRRRRSEHEALRKAIAERPRPEVEASTSDTVIFMAGELAKATRKGHSAEQARQLMELLSRRNALLARVNRDIQLHAQMQIWLYFHIPLTVGLLVALGAHIVTVFLYW